jgi:hypothetical protein
MQLRFLRALSLMNCRLKTPGTLVPISAVPSTPRRG